MEYQAQQREWRKEWNRLRADEVTYLRSHSRKRENIVNKKAAEIMPDDMQEVLNKAFDKAFALVFEKGTGFIEKTYPKEKIRLAHREAERELNDVIESGAVWKESAEEQTERTARALSKKLLYMKFLQTIPLAGIIGGTSDVWCMKRIGDYAELKYRRRFLINRDSMGQ